MTDSKNNKLAVALGFFDGVHLAHGKLLRKAVEMSETLGCKPAAVIFDRRPLDIVTGKETELINTIEDRKYIISSMYGISRTISIQFDRQFMRIKWDDFIKWMVKEYDVTCFVAGYDFRFGYRGEGDSAKLQKLCSELGVSCVIVDRVEIGGVTVSSTHIRELIRQGKMKEACSFLGHPHILTQEVIDGYKLGRTIGIPTANMVIPNGIITPKHGVYAARFCMENGESHMAITNVGVRPTVSGSKHVTVESHIIGYEGDLYGTFDRVEYLDFIRDEQKFGSVDELKNQINMDILKVKKEYMS